ncbi:MAG: hypothetical protein SGJ19_06505 [Planctomycetia bacterium]|nr:hypothetical protein [Planctomycetia bacterium]
MAGIRTFRVPTQVSTEVRNAFERIKLLLDELADQYVEGNLPAGLAGGATATIDERVINGKAIRSGFSLPSDTNFGAMWNGEDYTLIWADKCEVES